MIKNTGYCVCCDHETIFESKNDWLRDHYFCTKCGSIPRERALIKVIQMYYPNWMNMKIHESSPCERGASEKLRKYCKGYIASQYWPDRPFGKIYEEIYNINIEDQNFESRSFDLVVSQDVFEHLYNPEKAIKEISRTLKANGAHICTVPLVNKEKETKRWSEMRDGKVYWLY